MNRLKVFGLALVAWTAVSAQQATEVYIPIGESPGVSDSKSVIGLISIIEYEQHRMTISTEGGNRTVTMSPKTHFYMDKSKNKERNVAVDFEACAVGQRIEAYLDENGAAVWVKIEAAK